MNSQVFVLLLSSAALHAAEKPKPPMAKAPFDAAAAKKHQKQWAEYLGTPVEITNSVGMKLVLIPPGEFLMGSPESEQRRYSVEHQHRVRITKPFYLSVFEVTQGEYERVMGANSSFFSRTGDGKDRTTDFTTVRLPVERVSWKDAVEFLRRLSWRGERSGRVYRLPTEAEWEYACRAGTTSPYHFGGVLNGRQANCDGEYPYGTSEKGPNLERPEIVGSYPPNAYGLYDMHGNVGEWCADVYDRNTDYYATSPVEDPQGPTHGSNRLIRGGNWYADALLCRSASREWYLPMYRSKDVGFRVVMDVPAKKAETRDKPAR
jgi:formylglycine-generating enzyme required for sulfatase activity